MTNKLKVLFILKRRGYAPSYGLMNSCRFVVEALLAEGINAALVEVTDNNDIDREVAKSQPTHVIIEALWVVPEKFPVLLKLHPGVRWIVRLHSKAPFISTEGVAIQWLKAYHGIQKQFGNFCVASNSYSFANELLSALSLPTSYLPNTYSLTDSDAPAAAADKCGIIDIGCFGAIRPLKNHLNQAMAAIIFANRQRVKLWFHINTTRVEENSQPVLRNLTALFSGTPHRLVGHPWLPHDQFIELVRTMDYGMQASFSETFNIVAADFVDNEIPFVGSHEIEWLPMDSQADPGDWENLVRHLGGSRSRSVIRKNKNSLRAFCKTALSEWFKFLSK